jgi:sarcosine reductase
VKLELGIFNIENVIPADRTSIRDRRLYVNLDDLGQMIAEDTRFSKVEVKIVHPGDSVRIINVLDVIEPRAKVEGGVTFPGWLGAMGIAGVGKTHVLKGVGVIEVGLMKDFYGAILDMKGPGAELTNYSDLHHIILVTTAAPDIDQAEYSHALKIAGLKAATYLAKASISLQPNELRIYEIPPLNESSANIKLPRIVYLHITEIHEVLKEPFIYGDNPRRYFPIHLHPNELLDGAIVSCTYDYSPGLKNFTYSFMNSPVVEGLYERHGKELEFVGVAVANAPLVLVDKKRSAVMAAKLIKFVLGADGVIITKDGGGHPDVDLMECCEQCELLGVRTCLINSEMLSPDGAGIYSMITFSNSADCVISVGNVDEMVDLPAMEQVIGGKSMAIDIQGPFDKPMKVPIRLIPNSISQLGSTKVTTEEL